MSVESEKVLSGLEVEAILSHGSQHLFLLLTQNRLILAHHSKTGTAAVPMYSFLGKISEGLKRGPAKGETLRKMSLMSPDGILSLNRENFAVEYPRLVSMKIASRVGERSRITLLTADQKYELYASPVAVQGIREDVRALLGDKAVYESSSRD